MKQKFIYVIKCVNFYKIGVSTNSSARRNTIQTHCPLDVKLIATKPTFEGDNSEEKYFHKKFISKRTRGEWFELKYDDFKDLKVLYGFDFKVKITDLLDNKTFEGGDSSETKKIRAKNLELDEVCGKFEDVFHCIVQDKTILSKSIRKYGLDCVMEAIDRCNDSYSDVVEAYSKILSVSRAVYNIKNNPSEYFINCVSGIFKGYYKSYNDYYFFAAKCLYESFSSVQVMEEYIRKMHSAKFYKTEDEFYNMLFSD